ncbi:uncharacterized protein LOC115687943 isoform X1 [Syzygium oleosum]|uniref:uncharacterized protein LOC115687943 isoform X1 n=1 Tax=Syzygium oleosum TaxID=219896 RepID=UPI0024BBC9EE|nr:uncharacterized protein LOC115687943 isoform X1 [Syzygium oleosum]
MSRPWLLVFLLLLIVFTSQFEWKQQFGNENDLTPNKSQKEQYVSEREETVKEKLASQHNVIEWRLRTTVNVKRMKKKAKPESATQRKDFTKIILSQEKTIQKLNELVQTLRQQLHQCRGENDSSGSSGPLTEILTELDRHPILED